jgi:hypothetical protein
MIPKIPNYIDGFPLSWTNGFNDWKNAGKALYLNMNLN